MGKEERALTQKQADNGGIFRLGRRDYAEIIIKALILCLLLTWVFYDDVRGFVIFPGVLFFIYKSHEKSKKSASLARFDAEFKELMVAVSDALQSGYSIENAFRDAEENIKLLYGNKGLILNDLHMMNARINMRMPAEAAFMEFAKKHPTEESLGFAGVFSFARRLGGDYIKNIRRTVEKMEDKLELKQDIRATVAQKQMEFKIMSVMPIALLAYVKVSSGEFLSSLYGTLEGAVIMSACIGVYLGAVILGRRIVDIKV